MNSTPFNFSKVHVLRSALCLAAVSVSGAIYWFGTGLHPIWWLAWIAPLPVLLVAPRLRPGPAFAAAFVAWFIGGLNEWSYLSLVGAPVSVRVIAVGIPALVFAFAASLWRRYVLMGHPVRAALALSSAWVTYEFALQRLSPHSTFGNIAYSQLDCLAILQVASLTGILGISFLLFAVPGALAAILSGNSSARVRAGLGACTAVLLAAIIVWGSWRVHSMAVPYPADQVITVGLVSSDLERNLFPMSAERQTALFSEYGNEISRLIARGAQLVVIPEKIARVPDPSISIVDVPLEKAARTGATVVAGVQRNGLSAQQPSVRLNEARIYSADGRLQGVYEKHHMLPAFESDLLPGKTRTLLREPSGIWGVQICKDMDFPALSRQYGNDGAALMIVPAWDFVRDGWLHDRMAVMRGVESGFSIARAAKQGLLTVSDDRGRVLAEERSDSSDFSALLAVVPVRHDVTLYDRWGDWFGWLNVAVFLLLLLSLLKPVSQRPAAPAKP